MAMIDTIGRALAGFGAGVAGKGTEYLQQLSKERKEAMLQDAMRVEDLLVAGDVSKARELVLDRIQNISRLGGNASDSQAFLELLDAGNVQDALTEARSLVDYGQSLGMIKRPTTARIAPANWSLNKDLGRYERTNPMTGALETQALTPQEMQALASSGAKSAQYQQGTGDMSGYVFNPNTGKYEHSGVKIPSRDGAANLNEIRKETRSRLGKSFADLGAQATTVETNFRKLQGLSGQLRKGNRSAVVPAVVALVKLGDPTSVVSQEEVRSALNTQAPIAALSSLFRENGISGDIAESILTKLDPTAPENVDVDDLLRTADALLSSNIQSLQDNYAANYQVAQDNLTEDGIKSILPKSLADRVANLSNLSFSAGQAGQAGQSPTGGAGDTFYSPILKRNVTKAEIVQTAKERGISPDEIVKKLGIQRGSR